MVRGRRRVNRRKANFQCVEENHDEAFLDAPKVKDSKIEFQGKLSHASPIAKETTTRITNYFQQIPNEEYTSGNDELLSSESLPSNNFNNTEHLSDDTSLSKSPKESSKITMNTPHKIQLPDLRSPLSPATALSRLRISGSPKKCYRAKNAKSRRRLNISQNQNQLIQSNNLNHVCCKVPNSKCPSGITPQPPSENHKLTEYFPVRRSERKPKRTILEEQQRDMEEAILSGREEGLEVVHHFVGKGRGIVATRHFCKGEFVVEYAGELISMAEAKDREKKYAKDENTGCYMYYFKHHNQQYCVDATAETGRLGRLVNHSRNGNLATKTVIVKSNPHLVLIAKEDIYPSDEILYDYGDRSKESLRHHPWLAM